MSSEPVINKRQVQIDTAFHHRSGNAVIACSVCVFAGLRGYGRGCCCVQLNQRIIHHFVTY